MWPTPSGCVTESRTLAAHNLLGRVGAVAVAGHNDVDALERLAGLHTLQVVVGRADYLTVIGGDVNTLDEGGDIRVGIALALNAVEAVISTGTACS